MKRESNQAKRLLTIDEVRSRSVELSRAEEIKLQEEFIARGGLKQLPQFKKDADFERWQRIADFKRELQEKYKRPEATDEVH
jgi:hypothetical protein